MCEGQGGYSQQTPSQTPIPSSDKSMTDSSKILGDPSDIGMTSKTNQEDDNDIILTSARAQQYLSRQNKEDKLRQRNQKIRRNLFTHVHGPLSAICVFFFF